MVLSTMLFKKPAFKNLVCNGMVLAEDGKKMSKRLQNYPVCSLDMTHASMMFQARLNIHSRLSCWRSHKSPAKPMAWHDCCQCNAVEKPDRFCPLALCFEC